MKVYLLDGTVRDWGEVHGRVHEGVLYLYKRGYHDQELAAAYPLTSIERWEPS